MPRSIHSASEANVLPSALRFHLKSGEFRTYSRRFGDISISKCLARFDFSLRYHSLGLPWPYEVGPSLPTPLLSTPLFDWLRFVSCGLPHWFVVNSECPFLLREGGALIALQAAQPLSPFRLSGL